MWASICEAFGGAVQHKIRRFSLNLCTCVKSGGAEDWFPRHGPDTLSRLEEMCQILAIHVSPGHNAGIFEPLCAVYPVSMHSLVLRLLNGAERSIQHLVEPGLEERLLRSKPVEFSERALFENWNQPSDVVSV